jgi:hypothetical protein
MNIMQHQSALQLTQHKLSGPSLAPMALLQADWGHELNDVAPAAALKTTNSSSKQYTDAVLVRPVGSICIVLCMQPMLLSASQLPQALACPSTLWASTSAFLEDLQG